MDGNETIPGECPPRNPDGSDARQVFIIIETYDTTKGDII